MAGGSSVSLLDSLKPSELAALRPHLERVSLTAEQRLSTPGRPIKHAYFPIQGMISLVYRYSTGAMIEVGMIGREGFWGGSLIAGVASSPVDAMVQGDGQAFRAPAKAFMKAVDGNPGLKAHLLLHNQFLQVQTAITAACNGLHTIQPRLARWLLEAHDRLGDGDMLLKHEFLSYMLGVRRAGITSTLATLKAKGLIETGRGSLRIKNRKGLEAEACECYQIVKKEYRRIFSPKATA